MKATHNKQRFIAAGIMAGLVFGLMGLFGVCGAVFFPGYRIFSRAIMSALANVVSIAPFSLWDISTALLVLACCVALVVCLIHHKGFLTWLSTMCVVVSALALFLVGAWGLNHYAPPLAKDLGFTVSEYNTSELEQTTRAYLDKACEYAVLVERDEHGTLTEQDFFELAQKAGQSYLSLSQNYPLFTGSTAPVKKLALAGNVLLYGGSNGIFMPLTGESSVPEECANEDKPFAMCHEVAHRFGIASEEEANFAAFLACITNDDVRFAYCGYYQAFIYCYNALVAEAPEQAKTLLQEYANMQGFTLVITDLRNATLHYRTYQGILNDAGTKANDVYLKSFNEDAGVKSYGQVVDYLIAWNNRSS